jgi:hypothetical protein
VIEAHEVFDREFLHSIEGCYSFLDTEQMVTRTDEALWKRVVDEVTAGEKGGNPGQWSARKAQMAVQLYKKRGGGYRGRKPADNSLVQWTKQDWRTKSGRPSLVTGERYLPAAAIEKMTPQEYAATTAAKRRGMKEGKQYVAQPEALALLAKRYR